MRRVTTVTIELVISGRSAISRRALAGGLSVWLERAINSTNEIAALPEHIKVLGKTKIKGWRITGVEDTTP